MSRAAALVPGLLFGLMGLVMAWVGFGKWADPEPVRRALLSHGVIPGGAIGPVASCVTWAEVMLGASALYASTDRRARAWVWIGLASFLGGMLTYTAVVWASGRGDSACGCGVPGSSTVDAALARNVAVVLVMIGVVGDRRVGGWLVGPVCRAPTVYRAA